MTKLESLRKYAESFYLVPAASAMPHSNQDVTAHMFLGPDGYKQRTGKVEVKQKKGDKPPKVVYNLLKRGLSIQPTEDSGPVISVRAYGNQKVIVRGENLQRVQAQGHSKIVVEADSPPPSIREFGGKVIIRRPRRTKRA